MTAAVGSAPTVAAEPAADEDPELDEVYRVDAIIIEGLLRTKRHVVERELLFEEGDIASVADVEESAQRLRNTQIFRSVEYEIVDQRIDAFDAPVDGIEGPEGRLVRVRVEERWTLSAFFQFGQGGDTFRLLVGTMDTNLLGRYQHAEVMYSRLGRTNSFSGIYRNPRFLDARQQLSMQAALSNRLYTFYDQDGAIAGGFLRRRRHGSMSVEREWRRGVATGARTSYSADTFNYGAGDDIRREQQEAAAGLPAAMQTLQVGVNARFGQLDRDEYRQEGTVFTAGVYQNFHFGDVEPRSSQFRSSFRYFADLPRDSTFGVRGQMGFHTTDLEHMYFSAGGLDAIRGTLDMRHRGPHHWLGNVELRVPSLNSHVLVVQHVAFVDAVGVTDHAFQIFGLTAATTGVGLRVIARDFAGLIFRVDYALPAFGADGPRLSFGAGQFF